MSNDSNQGPAPGHPMLHGEAETAKAGRDCERPAKGLNAEYIPNTLVQLHDNRRALFYDDLLLGKTILAGCLSGDNGADGRLLKTFADVQALLSDQLGQEIFLYCISGDPERHTQPVLRKLADRWGAGPGWLFLTGEPPHMRFLRQRLFMYSSGHDCSFSMVRYGNESAGLWGGLPSSSAAEAMVERLGWVRPKNSEGMAARRKGPLPLAPLDGRGTSG